jgi:DNA-binding transcriptional LysR family regulator
MPLASLNITLRQIEAFLAVARDEGFTRAGERLHLTQSAVSLLVRELERQLGLRLFDRTTRAVRLTEAGRGFHPFAEKALLELQSAIDDARDLIDLKRGRVVVAAPPLMASHLVPPVLARFRDTHPGVTLVLRDLLADEILTRVLAGEVDVGIGTFPTVDQGIESAALARDTLILVCPKGHALAKRRSVRWRDLAEHPLISLDRHSSLRPIADRALATLPTSSRPAYEVSFVTTAIGMVEAGLGVAALPSYILLSTRHAHLVTRRLVEPVVEREISVVTRRGRTLSPAAQTFADLARQEIRLRLSETRPGRSKRSPG